MGAAQRTLPVGVLLLGRHPALWSELVDHTGQQLRELRQQVGTAHPGLLRELPHSLRTERRAEIMRRDRLVLPLADPRVDRPAVAGLGELIDQGTEPPGSTTASEQTTEPTLAAAETAAAWVTQHAAEATAPGPRSKQAHQDADEGVGAGTLLLTGVATDHTADDAVEQAYDLSSCGPRAG